jgi:hypothetical protein
VSAALDLSVVLSLELGMEQATLDDKSRLLGKPVEPVRLLWTNRSFIDASCCSLIGKVERKFCTRRRVGSSEDSTCGIQAHVQKGRSKARVYLFLENC